MKYYLILSEGAYSDYSPTYFVGDKEITQKELNEKGREIGDIVIKEWEALPTRPHVCKGNLCFHIGERTPLPEKYNPLNEKEYVSSYPRSDKWIKLMEKWLTEEGFEQLPVNIPEINTNYSDFPNNLDYPKTISYF